MKKTLYVLFGAVFGWLILWILAVVGVLSATTILTAFIYGLPLFAVIGLGWCLWMLFRKR